MDVISSLAAYVAHDRLGSLASGRNLPQLGTGSVLFADISGFTALTAGLSAVYGPRRGAGELSRALGVVYDGLVAAVEQWNGSVISFAGDAILCWFAQEPSDTATSRAEQALACARQMLRFLDLLPPLEMPGGAAVKVGLKVAVTTGPARRFSVGDPQIQRIDLLTGQAVLRAAEAETTAASGEILVDEDTWTAVGLSSQPQQWRQAAPLGPRFALVSSAEPETPPVAPSRVATPMILSHELLRPWILPAVWQRELAGVGRFLPEFRPTVALFVRFTGLDYDSESTEQHLNRFVVEAQRSLGSRGGSLLHVEIGDKGGYLYGAFGAPEVHADDARRAVLTALELKDLASLIGFLDPVHIGLSRGIMRTGSYGSQTRGCYSALGDEVNVAARLMEVAGPGQILVSGRVMVGLGTEFDLESLGALTMKGLAVAIPSFRLVAVRKDTVSPATVGDDLPLLGREKPLAFLLHALERARKGGGGVRMVSGDAGVGKTRLAEELRRAAVGMGTRVVAAQSKSEGTSEPWQVWVPVWKELFGSGETLSDSTLLETLDPKDKKSALEARAVADFRARVLEPDVRETGLLILLNDGHAMDVASRDLFFQLASGLEGLPVLVVVTSRPSDFSSTFREHFPADSFELTSLDRDQSLALVQARAAQLSGAGGAGLSEVVAAKIVQRSHGNPFFLEELVRFFHYRKDATELPDSVHALVLSRLDGVEVRGQSFLKCASILGLQFSAQEVSACFPELGDAVPLLDRLSRLGFLTPVPRSSSVDFEFRHPLTREAVYESIDSTARAELHNRYALWLEARPVSSRSRWLEALAHHFVQGQNSPKSQTYLSDAGDAAASSFLNEAALAHYRRLLPLVSDRGPVLMKLASVLELVGEWSQARMHYEQALALSPSGEEHWAALFALGKLARRQGAMQEAADLLARAKSGWAEAGPSPQLCRCCVEQATLSISLGNYAEAATEIEQASRTGMLPALVASTRGYLALVQGDSSTALTAFSESLVFSRSDGNRRGIADAIDNIARVRHSLRELDAAFEDYQRSLEMYRSMGDQQAVARTLNTSGMIAWSRGKTELAVGNFRESLGIAQALGDKPGQAKYLNNIGTLHHGAGEFVRARELYLQSLSLCRELGERKTTGHILCNLGMIEARLGHPDAAFDLYQEAGAIGESLGDTWIQGYSCLHRSMLEANQGRFRQAWEGLSRSLEMMYSLGITLYQLHTVAGLVTVYTRSGKESADAQAAAEALVAWVESGLSRDKARLESEFQGPWAAALAILDSRRLPAASSPPSGDWAVWLKTLSATIDS